MRLSARMRSVPPAWWFPIAGTLVVVVLGAAGMSGSSVSVYDAQGDGGRLSGKVRVVRTDEYWIRTPLVARAVELGFPDDDQIGVGTHDLGVVSQLPTSGLSLIVTPYTIPYHALPLDVAFALEWWILFLALPALGVYALLLVVGVRVAIAVPMAMVLVFSPGLQWWTMPPTGGAIGFATFAGAALIAATRSRGWKRVALAAIAGWLGACLVVVLYPPWVIPIGIVVAAGSIAAIVRGLPRSGERLRWALSIAAAGAVAAGVAAVILVLFVLDHRDAIRAITNTIYPGQRRTSAGDGPLRFLFVAPFDILQAARAESVVVVNGRTHLEPGGLPLLLVAAAALLAGPIRMVFRPWRSRIATLALLGAGLGLVAWYALPVPALIGKVTFLDRVPPIRLSVPLAVAGVLGFAALVELVRRQDLAASWWRVGAGVSVFVVGAIAAGHGLVIQGAAVPDWQVIGLVVLFAVPLAYALRGQVWALVTMAALLGVAAAFVNPLQHGLDALNDSPGARLGAELRRSDPNGRVLMLSDDPGSRVIRARGGLTASGVPMISGVNLYPDIPAWQLLDPDESDRTVWNRFNNASWGAGVEGSDPRAFLDSEDSIIVIVDPCDPTLGRLGVTTVVSLKPLDRSCLRLRHVVKDGPGTALRAYSIRR